MAIKYVNPASPLADKNKGMYERHNQSQSQRMVVGQPGEMYGLEMEVYSSKGQEAIINVANEGCKKWFVDMEPDGSLDPAKGLEVITRGPIPPSLIFTRGGWLARLLKRLVEEGGVQKGEQPRGYGLHINVNCAGWTWLEKNAFCAAVNYMPNINKKAAGRDSGGSSFNTFLMCDYYSGQLKPKAPPNREANCYIRTQYRNPDCMEVRMFQMNTDIQVIRGYITHLRDLREFSKKYQSVLLMCAALTCVWQYMGSVDRRFSAMNSYLETLFTERDKVTPEEAEVAFDKAELIDYGYAVQVSNRHGQKLERLVNEVFNPETSFERRFSALKSLWVEA